MSAEPTAADGPEPAIEIRGLSHWFDRRRVLADVDLCVAAGSIHGFVGPNGAGKTTTLNVLATLLQPKRGSVRVLGLDARREPKRVRRKVGYMPEHFAMYRQLTVFEYLDFFAAAHGQKFELRDARLEYVIETADIGSFAGRGIGTLSRGMQQRVCLARILLHDPMVLLLDEPASGLDPRARASLHGVVRRLADEGRTILMSLHILGELADACDHVTVLDRGHVRFSGAMRDLLARGEHGRRPYVVELDGTAASYTDRVAALPGVTTAAADGGRLTLELDSRGGALGAALDALLGAGARIVGVREDQRGLDEAFLELTTPGDDS